jgi:hypothetical protein
MEVNLHAPDCENASEHVNTNQIPTWLLLWVRRMEVKIVFSSAEARSDLDPIPKPPQLQGTGVSEG